MYSPASLGNILIVDDDKAIVDLLCFNFKSEGYSVKVVAGPSEVTAKTIADVHLMLVDDAHNDHSGIDLISRLRDTPQGASMGILSSIQVSRTSLTSSRRWTQVPTTACRSLSRCARCWRACA